MKFFNKILPWLSVVLIFIFLERLINKPLEVYWLAPLSLIVLVLTIAQLMGWQLIKKVFWQILITPFLFLISGLFFLSFLEGLIIKQFFVVIVGILLLVFFELVYLKFHHKKNYQVHSLETVVSHLNLFVVFLISTSFFGLFVFLDASLLVLIFSFLIFNLLLNYQLVWGTGKNLNTAWPYMLIITLITTEIFWAASFLSSSIYVNALLVTISYYLMTGLARNWLLEIKEFKVIKRYLVISFVSLIIILVTAKWF